MTTATTTEKPILFSTEMVRAIIEGRKNVTRRVITKKGAQEADRITQTAGITHQRLNSYNPKIDGEQSGYSFQCPYGKPGDQLWVRETFALMRPHNNQPPSDYPEDCDIWYKADKEHHEPKVLMGKWRPSIHMCRWMSRIQLKVEDIRVERVQDITSVDAVAEGIFEANMPGDEIAWQATKNGNTWGSPRVAFHALWDSINADRGYPWESNPWCWVIQFEVKNIKG